jgi:hypothetical protein
VTLRRLARIVAGIAGALLLAVALYVGFLFVVHDFNRDFLAIDRCLDDGGRWNDDMRRCDSAR